MFDTFKTNAELNWASLLNITILLIQIFPTNADVLLLRPLHNLYMHLMAIFIWKKRPNYENENLREHFPYIWEKAVNEQRHPNIVLPLGGKTSCSFRDYPQTSGFTKNLEQLCLKTHSVAH